MKQGSSKGWRGWSISSRRASAGRSPGSTDATTASKSSLATTERGTTRLVRTSRPSRVTTRWSPAASTASSSDWRVSALGSRSPTRGAVATRSSAAAAGVPNAVWSIPRMQMTRWGIHRSGVSEVTVIPPRKKSGRPTSALNRSSKRCRTSTNVRGTEDGVPWVEASSTSPKIRWSASPCHSPPRGAASRAPQARRRTRTHSSMGRAVPTSASNAARWPRASARRPRVSTSGPSTPNGATSPMARSNPVSSTADPSSSRSSADCQVLPVSTSGTPNRVRCTASRPQRTWVSPTQSVMVARSSSSKPSDSLTGARLKKSSTSVDSNRPDTSSSRAAAAPSTGFVDLIDWSAIR